jgi:ABC-type Zn uptake system ZnuABC Zn-binding protein ZnuA/ABC-type Mn2+/Zn2+ transport system permease subunit
VLDPFSLPFFQRGILEVLLLAVVAGTLGTWIVLRGMAFFAHAVGTAMFPGLVLADGLGFAAALGAFGAALATAGFVAVAIRRRQVGADSLTALVLAGSLATGVILASDVFASQARVDRLLFGSLLAIDGPDLALAAGVAVAAAAASLLAGPRWLAAGFAGEAGHGGGRGADAVLVVLVALAAVAALAATGALLATAILVVPAATARLVTGRMRPWQLATAALAALEGVLGMWLAFELNVPPGAAIAVLAGAVFALVAAGGALARSRRRSGAAAAAAAALAALGLGAGGCGAGSGPSTDAAGRARAPVAATTTQVGDLVRTIGGDTVTVRQILKPSSEAHDYEPRPQDVLAVAGAKVVFTSGLGLDAWSQDLVKDAASDATVVDLGAQAPVRRPAADDPAEPDPHWWHDPANIAAAATRIEAALIAANPAARATIAANARRFRARAAATDRAIRACLARVPAADRKIVTDHDAFAYFTERYGVTSVGAVFPSQSTQGQPSAGDLAALERTIRREHVRAVFPESSLNPKLAKRLAADTGASSDATLYGDTLGEQGTPAGTVLGAEAANAAALARGMTGGKVRCAIPS